MKHLYLNKSSNSAVPPFYGDFSYTGVGFKNKTSLHINPRNMVYDNVQIGTF